MPNLPHGVPRKNGNQERRRRLNEFPSGKSFVPNRAFRRFEDWSDPKRQVSRDSSVIDRQMELRTEPIHVARYRPDSSIRSVGAPENGMVYAWRTPSSLAFAIVPSDLPSCHIRPMRRLTASDQADIDRTGILGHPYNQQLIGIEPTGRQPEIGSYTRKPRDLFPQGELWSVQQIEASNSEKAIAPETAGAARLPKRLPVSVSTSGTQAATPHPTPPARTKPWPQTAPHDKIGRAAEQPEVPCMEIDTDSPP
jgi:hypothetical protein